MKMGGFGFVRAMLLAAALAPQSSGHAVADDSPPMRDADVIIVVEVAFVPYGNLVLLKDVLSGDRARLRSPEEYLGSCLPGKAEVRAMAQAGGKASAHHQAALERAGYSAVLFLRQTETGTTPVCDITGKDPVHWEQHPGHPAWRARLDAALAARQDG